MLARRPLAFRKSGPLPRRQVPLDRTVQRRNRRRRLSLTRDRASGQLTMDRRDVALPQGQQRRTSEVTVKRSLLWARAPGSAAADSSRSAAASHRHTVRSVTSNDSAISRT